MKSVEKTKEGTNSPNAIKLRRLAVHDSVWSAVNDKSSNRSTKISRNIKRWEEGSVAVYSHDLISALGRYTNLTEKFIQTFAGQNAAFDVIASSFLQAGDNVFIAGPTGDNFKVAAESCGAVVKYHYGVSPFSSDCEGIVNHTTADSKIIYLANPNHPTGAVYSNEEIEYILEQAPQIMLIVDESYFEYYGTSVSALVKKYDNLIIVRSFSEGLGLAGHPCHYIITSPQNINRLMPHRLGKNPTEGAQLAALSALKNLESVRHRIEQIRENMILLSVKLRGFGVSCRITPTDILLVKVTDTARVASALKSAGVFAGDLSYMPQLENYIFLNVSDDAASERIIEAFEKMPEELYRLASLGKMKIILRRVSEE